MIMSGNGGAPTEQQVADPALVKILQYYLDLANRGQLVGLALVGLDRNGNVYMQPAMPPNPHLIYVAMGALASLTVKLDRMLDQFMQAVKPSPILKPGPGMHA
jgi:hypothetical protein